MRIYLFTELNLLFRAILELWYSDFITEYT